MSSGRLVKAGRLHRTRFRRSSGRCQSGAPNQATRSRKPPDYTVLGSAASRISTPPPPPKLPPSTPSFPHPPAPPPQPPGCQSPLPRCFPAPFPRLTRRGSSGPGGDPRVAGRVSFRPLQPLGSFARARPSPQTARPLRGCLFPSAGQTLSRRSYAHRLPARFPGSFAGKTRASSPRPSGENGAARLDVGGGAVIRRAELGGRLKVAL